MLVKKPKRSDHPEGLIGDTIFLEEIANYHKARAEFAIAALEKISNADSSKVSSPIGSLHAAGIVTGWLADKEICDEALTQLKDNE